MTRKQQDKADKVAELQNLITELERKDDELSFVNFDEWKCDLTERCRKVHLISIKLASNRKRLKEMLEGNKSSNSYQYDVWATNSRVKLNSGVNGFNSKR